MDPFVPLDEFGFHHRLAETASEALVMFTGASCSSCRAWKHLLTEYHRRHPELALFEVDAGHAQALAREFGVFHLPALFLYRDGQFHGALQCEARPDVLASAISNVFSGPAQDAP